MVANINEAVARIKKVGSSHVRSVPMPGQNVNTGNYQIEIDEGNGWTPIVVGVQRSIADSIIQQAVNKVILG